MKPILIPALLIVLVCVSFFLSHYTVADDFAVFYHAGSVINNANGHNESVYDDRLFIYSVPVAYLFGALALLPYHTAKAVFILMNSVMYLAGIALILLINKTSGRWFAYPLALSCLWLPFVQDIRAANSNSILFFFVTLAAISAEKNRSALAGFLLGIASLFKLFPVAIAMVLGLKNWRIFVFCALTLGASLLVPGSLKWFSAIGRIANWEPGFTPAYLLLRHINILYFGFYVAVIAGSTAWIGRRLGRGSNYLLLASFAIPAVFLTMTIVEYDHLTLLAFSYVYILTSPYRGNRLLLTGIVLSLVLISSSFFFSPGSHRFIVRPLLSGALMSLGLFVLWVFIITLYIPERQRHTCNQDPSGIS